MSNTKIILDKSFFTLEITEKFIKDLELACKTMEEDLFVNLFIKYDLYYIEDYKEVLDLIIVRISNWHKPELGTKLIEVSKFDSKCIFCNMTIRNLYLLLYCLIFEPESKSTCYEFA